jgi:hypothetical protein
MAEAGEGEQDDVSFLRTVKIIYILHIFKSNNLVLQKFRK